MKLSPLDLRKQQFKKKFGGGYDPDEVRGFVEKLASDWEGVLEDQRQAESRVREMESKLKHYEKVELALQEALDSARETARRAEDAAERRARLIIEEAELRAQRMLQDAEQERYNIRQDIVKLSSRQAEITARLRAFLFSEVEMLAHFQGDDPIGFLKAGREPEALPGPKARLAPPVGSPDDAVPDEPMLPLDEPTPPNSAATPEPLAPVEPEPAPPEPVAPVEPVAPPEPVAPTAEAEEAAPEPYAAMSARRFMTPVEPEEAVAPEPGADEPAAPEPAAPAEPAEADEPVPLRTYHDMLSGRTSQAEEESEKGAGNPFATPFFRSPFFREGDAAEARPPETRRPESAAPEPAPGSDAAQGWSLRSLVTGEDEEEPSSVVASDDERERIRRILNDLD